MSEQPESFDHLDQVLAAYLEARERGWAPPGQRLLDCYPEHADELARFFADQLRFAPRTAAPPGGSTATPADGGPATDPDAPAAPGRPGPDAYEPLQEVGRGGMGVVYRGRDPVLGRELAVKVLQERFRGQPGMARRFVEEARVGGRLQHPGVVPVHELGTLPDGRPYFTMKLVEGRTLRDLLRARPDPAHELPRFLKIFEQVCLTVAYAHSKGVLHRDLKPANVMVGAFGEVQVMDWGLAKVLPQGDREGTAVTPARAEGKPEVGTRTGAVMGTYAYMPPEQARGEPVGERSDVFGLGGILCEVLTGRPPYDDGDPQAVSSQ